jgi:hypothetical protein
VSGPKVCSIPLQANEWRQHCGVSFDFNDAPEKTGRVFNAGRNQRFLEECCEAEQCRAVRLFVTPTMPQNYEEPKNVELQLNYL